MGNHTQNTAPSSTDTQLTALELCAIIGDLAELLPRTSHMPIAEMHLLGAINVAAMDLTNAINHWGVARHA